MTDGRDHVRRSKRYTLDAVGHGYPFYGRWDVWLGTLLTVLPIGVLTTALVPSALIKVVVAIVLVAVTAESSRAALGVFRANATHRRHITDAMSEEIGVELTVRQLVDLNSRLHPSGDPTETKVLKRVTDSYTAPDGSIVTLVMRRDGTVTAVRRRDTR